MFSFKCIKCKRSGDSSTILRTITQLPQDPLQHHLPHCPTCHSVYKPDIVFFGESFPKSLNTQIERDLEKVDCIFVVGTSLKVGGSVTEFLRRADASVPQILINKENVTLSSKISEGFDVTLLGCCDDVIGYLEERIESLSRNDAEKFDVSTDHHNEQKRSTLKRERKEKEFEDKVSKFDCELTSRKRVYRIQPCRISSPSPSIATKSNSLMRKKDVDRELTLLEEVSMKPELNHEEEETAFEEEAGIGGRSRRKRMSNSKYTS